MRRPNGYRLALALAAVLGLVAAAWWRGGPPPAGEGGAGAGLPAFSVPRLADSARRLTDRDVAGRIALINVWATWCVPCRQEHSVLMGPVRASGVPLYGLSYRDRPRDARRWLARLGDPYVAVGVDADGAAARALGARAAPETYLIDPQGRVVLRHLGRLRPEDWSERFLPRIRRLRAELERGRGST